jgi:hypothetical protein
MTEENPPETPYLSELREKIPHVWAESNPLGLANHHALVVVQLTSQAMPIQVKQYPINMEAKRGIAIHIKRLKKAGILVPCHSPWNTPLLPVRKSRTNDYCPLQDLRELNKRVETIHPMVPNPYTLFSLLPPSHQVYTILDLKDAFCSLLLAEMSQPIFAFEWTDMEEGFSGQLTWTRLPQGFKNSLTLFDEALSQDLIAFRAEHLGVILLQYVDDLLLVAENETDCREATEDLLKDLGDKG